MLNKYIITLIVGAVLSALSYAADNRQLPFPAPDTSTVDVPVLAVVQPQPPKPDDKNIVAEGPELAGGAYIECPQQGRCRSRDCPARWTCRGPLRRIVFAPLRWLFGRRC